MSDLGWQEEDWKRFDRKEPNDPAPRPLGTVLKIQALDPLKRRRPKELESISSSLRKSKHPVLHRLIHLWVHGIALPSGPGMLPS